MIGGWGEGGPSVSRGGLLVAGTDGPGGQVILAPMVRGDHLFPIWMVRGDRLWGGPLVA